MKKLKWVEIIKDKEYHFRIEGDEKILAKIIYIDNIHKLPYLKDIPKTIYPASRWFGKFGDGEFEEHTPKMTGATKREITENIETCLQYVLQICKDSKNETVQYLAKFKFETREF